MSTPVSDTEQRSLPQLDELRAEFLRRYNVLTQLRLAAIGSPAAGPLREVDGLSDSAASYLASDDGEAELQRWNATFSPAFDELDRAHADVQAARSRTVSDWWAGIRAELLAIESLNTRAEQLAERSGS